MLNKVLTQVAQLTSNAQNREAAIKQLAAICTEQLQRRITTPEAVKQTLGKLPQDLQAAVQKAINELNKKV